jgi:S1-C subfamily serine protease
MKYPLMGGITLCIFSLMACDKTSPVKTENHTLPSTSAAEKITLLSPYLISGNWEGAKIDSVEKNSPWEKAGLKAGDIVLSLNSQPIHSEQTFKKLEQEIRNPFQQDLEVLRAGAEKSKPAKFRVKLEPPPK